MTNNPFGVWLETEQNRVESGFVWITESEFVLCCVSDLIRVLLDFACTLQLGCVLCCVCVSCFVLCWIFGMWSIGRMTPKLDQTFPNDTPHNTLSQFLFSSSPQ